MLYLLRSIQFVGSVGIRWEPLRRWDSLGFSLGISSGFVGIRVGPANTSLMLTLNTYRIGLPARGCFGVGCVSDVSRMYYPVLNDATEKGEGEFLDLSESVGSQWMSAAFPRRRVYLNLCLVSLKRNILGAPNVKQKHHSERLSESGRKFI